MTLGRCELCLPAEVSHYGAYSFVIVSIFHIVGVVVSLPD